MSKATGKQPYSKPELLPISLVADEVLATGCKLAGLGAGPTLPSCSATPCVNIGTS